MARPTDFTPWRLIPTDTVLRDLVGKEIAVLRRGGDGVFVLRVEPGDAPRLVGGPLESLKTEIDSVGDPDHTLRFHLSRHHRIEVRAVTVVPTIEEPHRPKGTPTVGRPWGFFALFPLLVAIYFVVSQRGWWWQIALISLGLAVALWCAPERTPTVGYRIPLPDGAALEPAEVRRALTSGRAPEALALHTTPAPAADSRALAPLGHEARADVASLKDEYGRLLTDVAYRIENSALFDAAVPLTKQFQLALIAWDDEEARADGARLAALARELELSFATARRHAESVGLRHLPESARQDADRAAKASRLAQSATSEGERQAALHQATRLLRGLALYYLPDAADVPELLSPDSDQR